MEGRKMKIKVYIKRPDEEIGHSTWIENSLKNLPYNCTIHGVDFVGTIIVAGINEDEFGDVPLSFEEYKYLIGRERKLFI